MAANKLNIVPASKSARNSRRRGEFITFHPRTGKISFSLSLADKLKLKEQEYIEFMYSSKDKGQWYFRLGAQELPTDTRLKLNKPTAAQRRDFTCTSISVCRDILTWNKLSPTNSRSFKLVEGLPHTHGGVVFHEIDTKNPL